MSDEMIIDLAKRMIDKCGFAANDDAVKSLAAVIKKAAEEWLAGYEMAQEADWD